MRLFTFDPTIRNPGRSAAWTVRAEAIRQAQSGSLAHTILRDGYGILPVHAVSYVRCDDGASLAPLCAEIVAGLESRKNEAGTVAPILNGTPIALFLRRMEDLKDMKPAGQIVDGCCRTVASIVAYGCGKDDVEMHGVKLTSEQAARVLVSLETNIALAYAQKLDPWAKIEGAEHMLAVTPTTTEAELLAATGCKRGDGQLMHRAATAIRKHGLSPDRAGRCPGKEEWKEIMEEKTAAGAQALLLKYQTDTRAKALGIDMVQKALGALPESVMLSGRMLGSALASRETLDDYLLGVCKSQA